MEVLPVIEGDVSDYLVTINEKGAEKKLNAGVIIVATGLKDYPVENVTAYGYGRFSRVLKPIEFEERVAAGEINLKDIKSVVIINCAGSRDQKYLAHCSRVCCFIGLKEAKFIKDRNPRVEVYVCYIDMRSYGSLDSFYNTLKDVHKVNLIQGRPASVEKVNGRLSTVVEDMVLGELFLKIKSDYVVLSHGYIGDGETFEQLRIPLDSGDKWRFPVTYVNAALSVDSNPKGVFVCGCAAYSKNVAETISEARSAALSALPMRHYPGMGLRR